MQGPSPDQRDAQKGREGGRDLEMGVHCQGKLTSLVGADVGNRSEGLDGVQLANNDVTRGHALGTDRERDCEDDDK